MVNNGSQGEHSGSSRAGVSFSRWRAVWAIVALVGAAGGAFTFWRSSTQPHESSVERPDANLDEPAARDPGYVGPLACAPCHATRVAEFQGTKHFLACCVPQAGAMPSGFAAGQGTYTTRDPGLRFEMTQLEGDFIETAIHATQSGEQRTPARIAFAYGAGGRADEIYFTWHDDRLNELPIAWLHPLNRWGEQPFDPYLTGDLARTTTPRCLECHNTWFEHVAGTDNQYKRDNFILGVTCERCHGPGHDHVAFHQAHPDADSAHAIIHPGGLGRDRQTDLCGQCHSNAPKRRGPAFSYRPGEPLEAYFRTNINKRPEDDHVANQVHYLRQSKCFQKSATLTCVTCHDPHKPGGPAPAAALQSSCQKCHQPAHCGEQE